jgi:hypothetical protein
MASLADMAPPGAVQQAGGVQAPAQGFQSDPNANPTDPAYVAKFVQYLASQPGADPTLASDPNYWIGKITETGGVTSQVAGKEPGQGDNIGYWTGRSKQGAGDAGGGGQGGYGGQGGFGFDPTQVANNPGYQFALQQGQNAIQSSAAAKGTLLGTGTLKDLANYGAGAAYQGEGQLFNQGLQGFQTNFNNLGNLANTGYNATNAQGGYTTQAANAQAQGQVTGANATNAALGGVNNAVQNYNLYRQFGPNANQPSTAPGQAKQAVNATANKVNAYSGNLPPVPSADDTNYQNMWQYTGGGGGG